MSERTDEGPGGDGLPAILEYAYWGDLEAVRTWVWKGEPLEVTDELGNTPLILAAVQGHATCITALLEGGADLTARTNFGDTALTLAAKGGHVQTVRALLVGGADRHATGSVGQTAVEVAREHGHEDVADLIATWPEV